MNRLGDQRTRMSYLPDLNDYEKNFFNDEDEKDQGPDEAIPGWDVFKYYPLKLKTGSKANKKFFDRLAQISKVLTYFFLFFIILVGGIIAKGSIIFAVSQIGNDGPVAYCDYNKMEGRPSGRKLSASIPDEYSIGWYWCIIGIFVLPEFLGLMKAIYHWLFKKRATLRTIDITCLLIVDTLHTIGLATLFLLVLPKLNTIQAVTVSSCTCLVPAALAIFSRSNKRFGSGNTLAFLIGDILAFVAQLCGILVWTIPDNDVKLSWPLRWILPVAVILTSCRWWPNYVSSSSSFGFIRVLFKIKERLDAGKAITQGCSAIWRILIFFTTSVLVARFNGIEFSEFFDKNIVKGEYNFALVDVSRVTSTLEMKSPTMEGIEAGGVSAGFISIDAYYLPLMVFIIQSVASFVLYSSAKFAYRTMMQGYGFALPVNLIVPATVATMIIVSSLRNNDSCAFHKFLPDYVFFDVPDNVGDISSFFAHWYPWIWLLTLSSQVWITLHVWSQHSERLAATSHIFAAPTYDALVIDQSVVLNRRPRDLLSDVPMTEKIDGNDETATDGVGSSGFSKNGSENDQSDNVTRIFVCATMWHETEAEMTEFVGSILRLDMDQGTKRFTQGYYNLRMQDYYELETHIFFDDAFRCMHGCVGPCKHDENETQVNDYVISLINTMQQSVESLHILAKPPKKYPTPYGGRLEWSLPGKTNMIVHLKDKNKIRHRKRWSQVMYMYYLLGYSLMDRPISKERKEVIAENTYLLTLDGDIDFQPSAVKVLIDLMKRDKDLGAACGRIHPVGTGPMVWFQMFEYAIGHWLQKSTEHTIGSVLCSPGAFSLFRAKALMEHNVMRKYATQSTQPIHYVQYDQGEDRWLCTLILQVGYRVEYSAASDSYTHAPETFNEFYNQRRRWIPSTIANIFDLLSTSKETRKVNDDISWLYIVYQWVLMCSTVLGPGTIFLMLVGAFVAAFRIDNWSSFGYNLIPILIFVVVCFTCEARIQLIFAGIITAFYGLVMVVVLVGIMIQIAEDGWVAPSTILFFVVAGQLVVAGLLHPQEWGCLLCGLVYYVTVPSMYMLLIIFALFNVNNVTWGTRDSKTPVLESNKTGDTDRDRKEKSVIGNSFRKKSGNDRGSIEFSFAGLFKCILCTKDDKSAEDRKLDAVSESLQKIVSRLDAMEKNSDENERNRREDKFSVKTKDAAQSISTASVQTDSEQYTDTYDEDAEDISENESEIYADGSNRETSNFLVCPYWLQDGRFRKGGVEFLSREEETFWEGLIEKYLHPIDADKKALAKTAEGLKNLRDEYLFKFFMLNALFVLIIFLMQLNKAILFLEWPIGVTYVITYNAINMEVHIYKEYLELEPIGCLFIIGFVVILGVQFVAMLFHRFNTFSHILANTTVEWPCCRKSPDLTDAADLEKRADDIADGLQKVVENNAESILARKASAIAPGKRKTVRELAESEDRRPKLPANIDSLLCRNLRDSRSEISRFMSTRLPPNMFEAFERRHSSMVSDQEQNYERNNEINRSSNNISLNRNADSIPRGNSYNFDNRAFVSDDYGEDSSLNNEFVISHRPSQVTFNNSTT